MLASHRNKGCWGEIVARNIIDDIPYNYLLFKLEKTYVLALVDTLGLRFEPLHCFSEGFMRCTLGV